MSTNDIHGIEKGWTVKTADGQSAGSVEETTETYILAKTGLLNSTERYFPAKTLAHVRPEVKEVGISLTKDQVEESDWSTVPTELPRTEASSCRWPSVPKPAPALSSSASAGSRVNI